MSKKIIVEIDASWVLKHRDQGQLPLDYLKSKFAEDPNVTILHCTFVKMLVELKNVEDYPKFRGIVAKLLLEKYMDESICEALDFSDQCEEEECAPTVVVEQNPTEEGAIAKIDALVGAAEFKQIAHEIADVAEELKKRDSYEVFINMSYIFSIGDGCGFSTYVRDLADLFGEKGLIGEKAEDVAVTEYVFRKFERQSENTEALEQLKTTLDRNVRTHAKVFSIDISEWMDDVLKAPFRSFLKVLQENSDEYVFVFRIPFVEKHIFKKVCDAINDYMFTRPISVPPLTTEEIRSVAAIELDHRGFTVEDAAWEIFDERITDEKSDGKFYGPSTVRKVIRELIFRKELTNARDKKDSALIGVEDMKKIAPERSMIGMSGEEMLNEMIGCDKIKSQLMEMIAQIVMAIKSDMKDRPCIHMRFTGNPGTGKTTVARIVGKMLKDFGVLRIGAFFEYSGRDFCGRFVGETAPKTSGICRDAYGSVLFIDEAYSLYNGVKMTNDFGREALDTLIAEMENHRDDFVVIMAGYTDEMNTLMQGNSGLASRMPYVLEFPNFTRSELSQIFMKMASKRFELEVGMQEAVEKYFNELPDEVINAPDFSNARYVRNLYERTWAKASMRCQLSKEENLKLNCDDFERACSEKEFKVKSAPSRKMGFAD